MRLLPDPSQFLRAAKPARETAELGRRFIYILPTRLGLLYGVILASMLVGSINYTLSLGYILTFLLAGLGIVAMLHTWRNLAHVHIASGRIPPTFAGNTTQWQIRVADHDGRPRYAIGLRLASGSASYLDIPAAAHSIALLHVATHRRGRMRMGRITCFTEFPLGLFHAWSYVDLDVHCLVYPQPVPSHSTVPLSTHGNTGRSTIASGDEDFAGLRQYQPGDSPKRVDWKASAREQGLLSKQFQGAAQTSVWLDWNLASGDIEHRLSQLTRWLLDARDEGQPYGLRLPDLEILPGSGESHDLECLEALALFGSPP